MIYIRIIIKNIIYLTLAGIRLFIRQENIIIIGGPNSHRYGGNIKYLYEFLIENSDYDVFWLTESADIKKHLNSKGYKYLSNEKYFDKIYATLKCKFVIDSGTNFYNPFFLISRSKKVIKISTMHGSGPKLTLGDNKKSQQKILNKFNCVSFCTDHAKSKIGGSEFALSDGIARVLGQPKHDLLKDKHYVNSIYNKRKWCSEILQKNDVTEDTIIYYCPTWRKSLSYLPIEQIKNFNFKQFNSFLKTNNIYFLYTLHMMSTLKNHHHEYSNIKYVNLKNYPLFDNLELLMESDIMITDYSTLSTDYAILEKPQLFVVPDFEDMKSKKGFIEDPVNLMPGMIVTHYIELCDYIIKYSIDNNEYKKDYYKELKNLKEKYLANDLVKSREMFLDYISSHKI